MTTTYLTEKQVSEMFHVSQRYIANQRRKKKLAGAKIGNSWIYELAEVQMYFNRMKKLCGFK